MTSMLLLIAADESDEPQKVLIESNESWQSGIVLIYSTLVLISLRLFSTIRHSPLSPVHPPLIRLHLYAIVMVIVGAVSSITVLLLSLFITTRDIAKDLMPCASPLLAIGGILALYPQNRAPEWEAQPLAAVMGVPSYLAILTALIFNGLTVSASVLNGAWAATSISIATTLIAIFGPRTPVIGRTLANGLVEPGGDLIFKVQQYGEQAIIALCFSRDGKVIRELTGESWTKLQSIEELGHDKNLRIGASPVVSKVMVDDDKCSHLSLLSAPEENQDRCVQLVSGLTSDTLGYFPLQDWLRRPFGDDVIGLQIYLDDFTLQILGATTWSACHKGADKDFPGAHKTYGKIVRKLMEPMPRPTHETLLLSPTTIDLSEEMAVIFDEFLRCILKIEALTEPLPQPVQNILRVVMTAKLSKHFNVHPKQVLNVILDAVAGVISTECKGSDGELVRSVEELCVIFEGIDNGLAEDDDIYAVVTDKQARCVHWISKSDKAALQAHLSKCPHAIVLTDANQEVDFSVHVEAVRICHRSSDKLQLVASAIETHAYAEEEIKSKEDLNEFQWNESRLVQSQRVWPINWESVEPVSTIATVKGIAEIASLQAITSGIAAGSVLFGRLLGA